MNCPPQRRIHPVVLLLHLSSPSSSIAVSTKLSRLGLLSFSSTTTTSFLCHLHGTTSDPVCQRSPPHVSVFSPSPPIFFFFFLGSTSTTTCSFFCHLHTTASSDLGLRRKMLLISLASFPYKRIQHKHN